MTTNPIKKTLQQKSSGRGDGVEGQNLKRVGNIGFFIKYPLF